MAVLGVEGIAEEFGVPKSKVLSALEFLEEKWEEWVKLWRKKRMPEGLQVLPFIWGDTKELVRELVKEKFGSDDLELQLRVAITLDMMIS